MSARVRSSDQQLRRRGACSALAWLTASPLLLLQLERLASNDTGLGGLERLLVFQLLLLEGDVLLCGQGEQRAVARRVSAWTAKEGWNQKMRAGSASQLTSEYSFSLPFFFLSVPAVDFPFPFGIVRQQGVAQLSL